MKLSFEQKRFFVENGYLHLPKVISEDLVGKAMRAINADIGQNGLPPDRLTEFRAQSFCPDLRRSEPILNLATVSPAFSLAQQLIGEDRCKPISSGQIALRFPSMEEPPKEPGGHIDGTYSPTNGVKKGTIYNFTMLMGIMLSEVAAPYSGNLCLWPGTHLAHAEFFRKYGAKSLLDGLPPIDLPEPVQVCAQPGDLVLAHYLLLHGIAGNRSPHTRYAIYYRLHHVNHDEQGWQSMEDPWLEYEGLADSTPQPQA